MVLRICCLSVIALSTCIHSVCAYLVPVPGRRVGPGRVSPLQRPTPGVNSGLPSPATHRGKTVLFQVDDESETVWDRTIQLVSGVSFFALFVGADVVRGFDKLMSKLQSDADPAEYREITKQAQKEGRVNLSRASINKKLAPVPLFFVTTSDGRLYTEMGDDGARSGKFFIEPSDADELLEKLRQKDYDTWRGGYVGRAAAAEVWYPLIQKKGKLTKFPVYAPTDADYTIQASSKQVDSAKKLSPTFSTKVSGSTSVGDDIPLFGSPKLAFSVSCWFVCFFPSSLLHFFGLNRHRAKEQSFLRHPLIRFP